MTRLELVTLVMGRLGNRAGTTVAAQVVSEMQLRQTVLEGSPHLYWFLLSEETLSISTATPTVPTGFLRAYEDGEMFIYDPVEEQYRVVEKKLITHTLSNTDLTGDAGRPRAYTMEDAVLKVFPAPDQTYSAKWYVYKAEETLSSDSSTNAWTIDAPDLLAAETGYLVARYLRDFNAQQLFAEDIREARSRLLGNDVARKQAGYQALVGSGGE